MSQTQKATLKSLPILSFSRKDPDFRSKLINFLIENSVEFDRDVLVDQSEEESQKNGTTFNAMIRIFNIDKKSQTPEKKLPREIRPSVYKNLISRPVDEEIKNRKKNSLNKKMSKPKKKPITNNFLAVPQNKPQTRAIRGSVYSHLVKFSPPKPEKNFEELNKVFNTPQNGKKKDRSISNEAEYKGGTSKQKQKTAGKSKNQSTSSENRQTSKKSDSKSEIKVISRKEKSNNEKVTESKNYKRSSRPSPKTEVRKPQKSEKISQFSAKETSKKHDRNHQQGTSKKNLPQKNPDHINNFTPNQTNNNNSESYSNEGPSLSVSAMNKMYDELLNKTYEFKKSEISFQAGNSDEDLKELCDKIRVKSGFHESHRNTGYAGEDESFKKNNPFLEESGQNKNILLEESPEGMKNAVDNKDLSEKLGNALKILESQKIQTRKSMEERLEDEFIATIEKHSEELEKEGREISAEIFNRNLENLIDKFFVKMDFLSSQELLYYYRFILKRAKFLYFKFLKTRGKMS